MPAIILSPFQFSSKRWKEKQTHIILLINRVLIAVPQHNDAVNLGISIFLFQNGTFKSLLFEMFIPAAVVAFMSFTYFCCYLSCNVLLLNLSPQPSLIETRSYYILIKNRLRHVREHRLIRWCIFHTALLQYDTTRWCIRISIIHKLRRYIWHIYFSVCFGCQAISEDARVWH